MYLLAAQITLIIHFIFILFVCFGAFLVIFRTKIFFFHFPSFAWAVYLELTSSICPLTYLEKKFLQMAGLQGYPEGFIEKYIFNTIYPLGLTDQIQIRIALLLILTNCLFYFFVLKNLKKKKDNL
ncbi:MAG: hypothetical protein CMM95_02660 [Rickettsiales bacterium]|mgnify:CR=1 FL=1|nr:hypothetical protein [Rickettsiales bacterium]